MSAVSGSKIAERSCHMQLDTWTSSKAMIVATLITDSRDRPAATHKLCCILYYRYKLPDWWDLFEYYPLYKPGAEPWPYDHISISDSTHIDGIHS
jgi:hypothetical protein